MFTRDEMIKHLNKDVCVIKFTKVTTGEERYMKATLVGRYIPAEKFPTSGGNYNPDIIRCFDMDKQQWRSFRVDSVTYFEPPLTIETDEDSVEDI